MSVVIGHEDSIVDEAVAPDAAALTGRPHLLSTAGPATPVVTRRADTEDATLNGQIEVLLRGGCADVMIGGYDSSEGGLPSLEEAIALLPQGPGTGLVPAAVTSADLIDAIPAFWAKGKVMLASGASGATVSTLTTLADAVRDGCDARGGGLFADWATWRLTVGTINAPATFGVAAAIARNDRESRVGTASNTALAAAGKRGVLRGAESIIGGVRTQADRDTLADAAVNTCIQYGNEFRNYVFRSLADLAALGDFWWDIGGARVICDVRARYAMISAETHGDPIDGVGVLTGKLKALADGELMALYRAGALYGATSDDAFTVDTGETINPPDELQLGRVRRRTRLSTAPHVEYTHDEIVRRPIAAA